MKIYDIIKTAHSNLFRSKGRTILTIVAIFIGAFTISITTGVNTGVNDYIDKQVNGVGGKEQLIIQTGGDEDSASESASDAPDKYDPEKGQGDDMTYMTQKDFDKIAKMKNIASVKPFQNASFDYIQGSNNEKFVFSGATNADLTIDLEAGKAVDNNSDQYEIDLAPEYVKSLGYKNAKAAIGQTVTLAASSPATKKQTTLKATIVGVRNTSVIQGGASIINESLADKIVELNENGLPDNMKNRYYGATATMKKDLSDKQVTALKDNLSKAGYMSMTVEDQIGMIKQVINAITGVLTLFGAIALLAASFGIINTLYMSVQDRTREIGLMKAMGMGNGKVFLTFSVEALLIGFWGAVFGILGAMGAGALINKVAGDSFLEGLSGFTLIQFSLPSIIVIILVIMLIAFLAGTLPANRAARLDPINALRYE